MTLDQDRTILLATIGSLGDVYPFIALSLALKKMGYAPLLATLGAHRSHVEAAGIAFLPLRPDRRDLAAAFGGDSGALFRHQTRHPSTVVNAILKFLPETYHNVLAASEAATHIVASSFAFGAVLAAEKRGLPLIRVVLAPHALQSAFAPSLTGRWPFILRPRSQVAVAYNQMIRYLLIRDRACRLRSIGRFRAEIGLPRTSAKRYLGMGTTGAAAEIGLFSLHFASRQPDHPPNLLIAGFPYYDGVPKERASLDPDLQRFLAGGDPPIVFTLGTFAVRAPGDFYGDSLLAARALKRRAVLLAGASETKHLADSTSTNEYLCAYALHSQLFPQAAAIVHHGGIGTTSHALRAGKPQLVVPFFGDQPDNARRLEDLGVARTLEPSRYTVERATTELGTLLMGGYTERAQRKADDFALEDGAEVAARHIASLIERK
jgi:UDP:flavonoid glycosyltransferase YjiC (YdhE family)